MSAQPLDPSLPPLNAELNAWTSGATPEALRRALRIVLGAEQATWERDLLSGENWYSPSFYRLVGLPPSLDRDAVNARIHPDDLAAFEHAYAEALQRGGSFTYDLRFRNDAGDYRWMRATGRVWLGANGQAERLIGNLQNVHAEKAAQLEAQAHAARHRRALEASSEAYFETTAGLDDFYVSDNLPPLLGHPEGAPAPGVRAFLSWVHPDDLPALQAEIDRAWQDAGPWQSIFRLRTHAGEWRWFRGRGRSEVDAQGRVRMSGLLGDVHQQQLDQDELHQHRSQLSRMVAERTVALDAALADAERLSRAKSEFLAHMSHELRTPLNGLVGLTELALRAIGQPTQRRYLEVARDAGRTLRQLIDALLDFSDIAAGSLTLADKPFDLAELVAQSLRALAPDVAAKPLSLRYDWVGEGSTWVRGDEPRVRQVVTNLLANAIKFTERGHVAVRAEWVVLADGRPAVSVQVDDTGPGIAQPRREAIFDAFVQGDGSLTRSHGGVGLGLAIARRIARALDGDVQLLRSGPDGSGFEFRWPAQAAPEPQPLPAVTPGRAWLVNRVRPSGEAMGLRLQRLHWQAEIHASLDDALACARASAADALPDLVVIAQNSLGDGIALQDLHVALPGKRLAIVVRPVWRDPVLELLAASLAIEVCVMPLSPRDLRQLLRPNAAPQAAAVAARGGEPRGARILVVEDNTVNSMIVEAFLRQLGFEPRSAGHGGEALAACAEEPPALVLMDLQMPVMDGLEATRQLRGLQAEGRLPHFPILALTAHSGDADRAQAAAAGVDDYLTKPILLEALRDLLARHLPGLGPAGSTPTW